MGFSRQEYWSGLPFPSPEDLPDPGIEPRSPALQADALSSEPPGQQTFREEVSNTEAVEASLQSLLCDDQGQLTTASQRENRQPGVPQQTLC